MTYTAGSMILISLFGVNSVSSSTPNRLGRSHPLFRSEAKRILKREIFHPPTEDQARKFSSITPTERR